MYYLKIDHLILTSGNYSTHSPILLLFDLLGRLDLSSFTYNFGMGYFLFGRCHVGQYTHSDSKADRC